MYMQEVRVSCLILAVLYYYVSPIRSLKISCPCVYLFWSYLALGLSPIRIRTLVSCLRTPVWLKFNWNCFPAVFVSF
jgi:hypothetical protein